MQSLFAEKKHAFYRFATVLPIPQIPEEAWMGYITRKFNEKGINISSDYVLKEIVQLAGGHPQDTMLILFLKGVNRKFCKYKFCAPR